MTFPWQKRRAKVAQKKVLLQQTEAFIDETQARVIEQAPRVNRLTKWAEARRMTNGFGEDFEWTLAHPRRARG